MGGIERRSRIYAIRRKMEQRRQRVLAGLACVAVVATAAALMVPAVTITEDEAQPDEGFYLTDAAGSEAVSDTPQAEPAAEGEAAADATEGEATADTVEGEASANAAEGESEAEQASEDAEAQTPAGESDANADVVSSDSETTMPAQKLHQKVDLGQDITFDVYAEVKADVLPEGAELKLGPVAEQETQDLIKATAEEKAKIAADASGLIATDISFTDAKGNPVEPQGKVLITFTSNVIEPDAQVAVVRVDYAEHPEDPESKDTADVVTLKELDPEKATLKFETEKPAPYALVYIPPVDGEDTEADDEQSGEGEDGDESAEDDDDESDLADDESTDSETTEPEPEPVPMPAKSFTATARAADGSAVDIAVDAEEGTFPEGTIMTAELVTNDEVLDAAKAEAANQTDMAESDMRALAADITFTDADGNPVEPAKGVRVAMVAQDIAKQDQLAVVHVDGEANAQVVEGSEVAQNLGAVYFDADAFSVYAVVYTVDFHYEVDGQVYEYSMNGDSSVGLRTVLGALNVVEADQMDDFIADIDKVEFSNPDLLEITHKEPILGVFGSEDYMLKSLAPFTTDESLTVTLEDGEVFTILVTDAQIMKNVLTADGENYTIIVKYDDEAEIPEGSDLEASEVATDTDEYERYLQDSADQLGITVDGITQARFFDIEIVHDGEKVEPAVPVQVIIRHDNAIDLPLGEQLNMVHFAESGTEVISDIDLNSDKTEVSYEQESFSVTGQIMSNPTPGSVEHPNQYAVVVKWDGAYYSVDSDGTLSPVEVDNPDNPTIVTIGSAMLWSYDSEGSLYHHTEATDTGFGEVAADFYYKYIDINSESGIYEEEQITDFVKGSNPASGSPYKVNDDVILEVRSTTHPTGSQQNAWCVREHRKKTALAVSYDAATNRLFNAGGTRVLDVEVVYGIPRIVSKPATQSSGVDVFFTDVSPNAAGGVPSVSPYNHTVNHIDVAIEGEADVAVPLAYGTYSDAQGNPVLKIVEGVFYEWSSSANDWVLAYDDHGVQYSNTENPITVHKSFSGAEQITPDDIKAATISATDADGNVIENAFYITGYSGNAATADDPVQVRIEGSFKVADLPPMANTNGSPNTSDIMGQRLANQIYYTVTTTKHNVPLEVKYKGVQLYNEQGDIMSFSTDVSISSGKFGYWDATNTCPALSIGGYQWNETTQSGWATIRWSDGGIYTGMDPHDANWYMSGIDNRLKGDKVIAKAEIPGMEITKYIVDTTGKIIPIDLAATKDANGGADLQNRFTVYEKAKTADGYDPDDVKGLNGGDATRGTRTLPAEGQYTDPATQAGHEGLYNGYTEHEAYDVTIPVGPDGQGFAHNYNVEEGLYYIQEDTSTIADKVVGSDGTTFRYIQSHLESEYAWRDDENHDGRYSEPVHVSPTYTDPSTETYRSVPEVLGNYKDANGSWVQSNGQPVRNTMLPFYVYNVYIPDVKLDVEKKWVNVDAPEGAEVQVELQYAKRIVKTADGTTPNPMADWPDKSEYQPVAGAMWDGTSTPIFESSVTSQSPLMLSANADDAEQNWKGSFTNLPHRLTDAQGNVWEFDYMAKETAVTVGGENIMGQFDTAETKTEPDAGDDSHYSDGKVTLINAKGGLTVEKKWLRPDGVTEYTPGETNAEITAELHRKRTVTTVGEDIEEDEAPVTLTVMARSNNGNYRQMFQIQDLGQGKSVTFSVGNSDTSWFDSNGATVSPNTSGARVSQTTSRNVTYTGNYSGGKNNANVYTVSNVTENTTVSVTLPNTSNNNIGYWFDSSYEKPGKITIPGETTTENQDELVNLPAKVVGGETVRPAVVNGVIKLNSTNGWKFTLMSADMDPDWEYYIKEDSFQETGVPSDEFEYVAPEKTTTEDGYTVYTAKNISKGVNLDVHKTWGANGTEQAPANAQVTVELMYRLDGTGEYAPVKDQQGAGKLFDSSIVTTLALDSSNSWAGNFEGLPTTVRDSGGNHTVEYTAKETKVTIDGKNVTGRYTITENKEDPATPNTSAGSVTINNTKETVQVTAQKAWDPTPTDSNASATVELHRYAKKTLGSITLHLVDQVGAPVPGATYVLYKDDEATETTAITNDNGDIEVTGLGAGAYKLVQQPWPSDAAYAIGSHPTETDTYTVTDTTEQQEPAHFDMANDIKEVAGSVTLTVEACEGGGFVPLANAVVSLYKEGEDTPIAEGLLTDAEGHVTQDGLKEGNYHFKLTGVPDDYRMPTEAGTLSSGFTIDKLPGVAQSKTDAISHDGSDGIYQSARGTVTVVLKRADNDAPIVDATFTLTGAATDGTPVNLSGTTGSDGTVTFGSSESKLHAGTYTIHQVSTADGLKTAADATVEIEDIHDNNQSKTVELTNAVAGKGAITVNIQKENNAGPIVGATVQVKQDSTVVKTGTTDANGTATFNDLDEGTYTVHQVDTGTAGDDYSVAADPADSFTVVEGSTGQTKTYNLVNEEASGNVTIQLWRKGGTQQWNWELANTYNHLKPGRTYTFVATMDAGLYPDNVRYYHDSRAHNNGDAYDSSKEEPLDSNHWNNGTYTFTFTPQSNDTTYSLVIRSGWGVDNIHSFEMVDGAANSTGKSLTNPASAVSRLIALAAVPLSGNLGNTDGADGAASGEAAAPYVRTTTPAITNAEPVKVPAEVAADYMEDSTFTPIAQELSGGNWSYTFPAQDKYDADGNPYYYYVVETSHTPTEYWIDSYTDPVGDTDSGTITVTNKLRGQISIQKTFSGNAADELTPEQKAGITFTVTGPNGFSQTFNYGEDDTEHNATWSDGTLTITDLAPGNYTVAEANDNIGNYTHTSTMTVNGNAATTVTATKDGNTIVVDNKYDSAKLEITKSVTGLPAEGTTATFTFRVEGEGLGSGVVKKLNYPDDFQGGSGTVTLTQADGIVAGATYTVTEEVAGANVIGYTRTTTIGASSFTQAGATAPTGTATVDAETGEGSIAIANDYTQNTTSVNVDKRWAFADGSDTWPADVTVNVQLYSKTGDNEPAPVEGKTLALDANHTSGSFDDLPEYDGQNKVDYSVVEAGVTGVDGSLFNTSVGGSAATGYTITNTQKAAGLTIIKTFSGATLTDDEKAQLTFTVTGEGLKDRETNEAVESLTKTYAEFQSGQWVLDGNDGIVAGGTYTVTETSANVDKYTRVSTVTVDGGEATTFTQDTSDEGAAGNTPTGTISLVGDSGTVTINNDYAKETTEVSGTKTWVDGREHDNANELTLTLKRTTAENPDSPDAVWETVTVASPITLTWDSNTYTFANLDKYASNNTPATADDGKLYTYKVEETATVTDGGTAVSYQQEADGNNFTNTELTNVEATKTWKDSAGNNVNATMTNASVTFELQEKVGEGEWTAVSQQGPENPKTITVGATADANAWKATWSNLPKYRVVEGANAAIQYRVVETAATLNNENVMPAGSDEGVAAEVSNGSANIENTLPNTQITVTKQWKDGTEANADRIFPEAKTIGFTLHQKYDGKDVVYTAYGTNGAGTVTYTPAAGETAASWSVEQIANLPKYVYDADTATWCEATYYVTEDQTTAPGTTVTYQLGTEAATDTPASAATASGAITIVNTDQLLTLNILKVDERNVHKLLSGAKFELHRINENNAESIEYLSDEAVLPTTTGANNRTGDDGAATFSNLAAGYYEVKEVLVPAGYVIKDDKDSFYIKVDAGAVTLLTKADGVAPSAWESAGAGSAPVTFNATTATATVQNAPGTPLPHTGGVGTRVLALFGSLLIAICGAMLVRRMAYNKQVWEL